MFDALRLWLGLGPRPRESESRVEAPHPPAIHKFHSQAEWLAAWVRFKLDQGPLTGGKSEITLPCGPALRLACSLGYDSALAPDGTVWINIWEIDKPEEKWRVASPRERTAALILAQRRHLPELIVLLPLRPNEAADCAECQGEGFIAGFLICEACGALGWKSPDA